MKCKSWKKTNCNDELKSYLLEAFLHKKIINVLDQLVLVKQRRLQKSLHDSCLRKEEKIGFYYNRYVSNCSNRATQNLCKIIKCPVEVVYSERL